MNEIQIFNNPEFGNIRTVLIDGEPWIVAKDVSEALGYVRTPNMMKLVDDEDKRNISSSDLEHQVYKQNYTIGIINESGLYAAIFGSKQENAKKFKKWVTSEVLPSIRKTGSYGKQDAPPLTLKEQVRTIAQGTAELYERVDKVAVAVDDVKSEIETIKNDLPILPIEADEITKAVRRRGVQVLGGKESPAYNDRGLRQRVYNNLYANLKYNFEGIRSYKAIRRKDTDKAIKIVNEYNPPLFLAEQIEAVNTQQSFDFEGGAGR